MSATTPAELVAEMRAAATTIDKLNKLFGFADGYRWSSQWIRDEAIHLDAKPDQPGGR